MSLPANALTRVSATVAHPRQSQITAAGKTTERASYLLRMRLKDGSTLRDIVEHIHVREFILGEINRYEERVSCNLTVLFMAAYRTRYPNTHHLFFHRGRVEA